MNIELLELAAAKLGDLLDEVVFVGGATVELWITDPAAPDFRLTEDIDVIVDVATRSSYEKIERRVEELGFRHDQESGVTCRFRHRESGLVLDVMPTEGAILGLEGEWLGRAFPHAVDRSLPSGAAIRAIPPPFVLATKLEAFRDRGNGDFLASRDWQDVIALVDGRDELAKEVELADRELRSFVASELSRLQGDPSFAGGVAGGLRGDPSRQARAELVVLPRIRELIGASGKER